LTNSNCTIRYYVTDENKPALRSANLSQGIFSDNICFSSEYGPLQINENIAANCAVVKKYDVIVPNNVTVCYHLPAFLCLLMNIHELHMGGVSEITIQRCINVTMFQRIIDQGDFTDSSDCRHKSPKVPIKSVAGLQL
jgi:hypothetical protein